MANTVLLRWNDSVSGECILAYRKGCKKEPYGFHIVWNIPMPQHVRKGDRFVMLYPEGDKAGIISYGYLESDPVEGMLKGKPSYFINIFCLAAKLPSAKPIVKLSVLSQTIHDIDWNRIESGSMLTTANSQAIQGLIDSALHKDYSDHPAEVDVWINWFFRWGVAPKQITMTISWDDFVALTCGNPEKFEVQSMEYLDWISNPETRFKWKDLEASIDRTSARRLLKINTDSCVACNIVRIR